MLNYLQTLNIHTLIPRALSLLYRYFAGAKRAACSSQLGFLLLLASCSSVPTADGPGSGSHYPPGSESSAVDHSQLLAAAPAIEALDYAVREQQWQDAARIASHVDTSTLFEQLNADSLALFTRLATQAWMQTGDYQRTVTWLEQTRLLAQVPLMRLSDQLDISSQRADALHALGDYAASAQERVYIAPLLSAESDRSGNADGIWRSLQKMSQPEIESALQLKTSENFRGWLELALIDRSEQIDLGEQIRNTKDWQQRWPKHSAAGRLPNSLRMLEALNEQRARAIGLLLPLSGPLSDAGNAILNGVATAYFQASINGWELPTLTTYDSAAHDVASLYDQAVSDGCDFIIGPLRKDQVAALLTMPTAVPVLTLNYVVNDMPPPDNIVQFGLAAEDEARQLAEQAVRSGMQRSLVLQSRADWSSRASNAYIETWEAAGGQTVQRTVLGSNEDFSKQIADSLLLPDSEQRHRRLQQVLGQTLEFTPRRRADIDNVVLFANHSQARSIKPLLAYHYAKDVPVLATSQVFQGNSGTRKSVDLDGITFNETPWVLNDSTAKSAAATRYQQDKQLGRLFAMGVDAFYLHPRLQQLRLSPDKSIAGLTGDLSWRDQRIARKLLMATIRGGEARILSSTAKPETN